MAAGQRSGKRPMALQVPELYAEDPPRYAIVTAEDGTVVAASLRTPPHNQVHSQVDDPSAAAASRPPRVPPLHRSCESDL